MQLATTTGLAMVLLVGAVHAQAVKLTGDEIRKLLTGNTAIGRWEGANYRQFFGADGVTFYAQEGARSARGEWRVDDTAQEYQSIWPNDPDWEGWFVIEYGETYYWVSRATPPTPFQVLEGEALVPKEARMGTCTELRQFVQDEVEPSGATCTTSRVLGEGVSTDCHWSFDFRSEAARNWFEESADVLRKCADGDVKVEGATVNHPDSFDQLTAQVVGRPVSLSLKDKGALGQTLVFLRRSEKAE